MSESTLDAKLKAISKKNTGGGKNFAEREIKDSFPIVQIGNSAMRFGIHYSYLRPMQYLSSEDAIFCAGNGQQFAIYGKNILLLFELLCACAVAKIIEGDTLEFGETKIYIERVMLLEDEEESEQA